MKIEILLTLLIFGFCQGVAFSEDNDNYYNDESVLAGDEVVQDEAVDEEIPPEPPVYDDVPVGEESEVYSDEGY